MKKFAAALHGLLGLLLALGFAACVVLALHDDKGPRRGVILIPPRP